MLRLQTIHKFTYRGITADHYLDGSSYLLWCYFSYHPEQTICHHRIPDQDAPLSKDSIRERIDHYLDGPA